MNQVRHHVVKDVFFFIVLALSFYLVWNLFAPFVSSIALAAIITTICYPLYERILHRLPNHNASVAASIAIVFVITVIVIPLTLLASLILHEAISIYSLFNTANQISFIDSISKFETLVQTIIPSFSLNVANVVQQTASFVVNNLVNIFAGTASTLFLFFIALIASYYFFKDGKYFTEYLIRLSPLEDTDDTRILKRLALAIRSVALGTVTVAIIQGVLTAIGLTIFGFDRAILWGCVAAIGALVPSVGTTIIFIPAVLFLLYSGAQLAALLLAIWGVVAVGLIDNLLGPYMMSRGNNMHPFLTLLAVLGGISMFGPIGFILGPVVLSLFLVLLEMYHVYLKKENQS